VTKVESARIATGAGIPVVLTSAANAAAALAGEPVGTLFHATGRRRPRRLLWLAHATDPKGRLVLDDYYFWSGCREATNDYFAQRSGYRLEHRSKLHVVREQRTG